MAQRAQIKYFSLTDDMRKEEKLQWFAQNRIKDIDFGNIHPDKDNNWINLSEDNDWEELLSLEMMSDLCANGINTARDEWVYDYSTKNLESKIKFFADVYNLCENSDYNLHIKWSEGLKSKLKRGDKIKFKKELITVLHYRPFVKQFYFFDKITSDRLTESHFSFFSKNFNAQNSLMSISLNCESFRVLSTICNVDWHFMGDTKSISLYRYDKQGNRLDNLTDWGLQQFQTRYASAGSAAEITKENIFHYVYAVLHNPAYRSKYELNLKRDFPRIPFYADFQLWAAWGKALMELHIGYETVKQYDLQEVNLEGLKAPKAKLKADKEAGIIILDEQTSLTGIPPEAWLYKLGNRSALEWILDQYKEKKPSDPTIAEKFNTYRFADYKAQVIDLLKRVCTVSVETMKIVGQMPEK